MHVQTDNDMDVACVQAENVNKYISLNYCGVHMDGFGQILPVLCILGLSFFPVTVTVIQLLIVKEAKSEQV